MSEYTPDRWLAVEITLDDGASLFKILGSWFLQLKKEPT